MARRLALMGLLALALVSGCASRGPRPRPFPAPVEPPAAGAPSEVAPGAGGQIVESALGYLGTPYRNGGTDPGGFDCSGFVQFVFARHGVVLPRSVAEMSRVGAEIETGEIRPADLLFFSTTGPGATHVAIALGDGRFVHAPSQRGSVRVEGFGGSYWPPRFVGARRVISER